MTKFIRLILTALICMMQMTFAAHSAEHFISGGVAIGNGYTSGFASYLFAQPDSLGFGADASLFNFTEKDTTSKSYYGALYTQNRLWEKSALSVDWIVGATYSQSVYSSFSSDAVFTPGIGIAGRYVFSPKWLLNGKAMGIIYSDGFSVPYQVGVSYPIGKVSISAGIQGLLSLINSGGNSTSSNSYGFMLGVQY